MLAPETTADCVQSSTAEPLGLRYVSTLSENTVLYYNVMYVCVCISGDPWSAG